MEERKNRFILFGDDESTSDVVENNTPISEVTSTNNIVNDILPNKQEDLVNVNDIRHLEVESDIPYVQNEIFDNIVVNPTFDNQENNIKDDNQALEFNIPSEEEIKNNLSSIFNNVNNNDNVSAPKEESTIVYDNPLFNKEESNEILDIKFEEEEESDNDYFEVGNNIQNMINKILHIDSLEPVRVDIAHPKTKEEIEKEEEEKKRYRDLEHKREFNKELMDMLNTKIMPATWKSNMLDDIKSNMLDNEYSMLSRYGEDYTSKDFVTNPSIGRDEEIRQLILTLLTPEKSAILVGKPGIGKTSIVEGLAYRLQRNIVPEALKEFSIINIKTPSLLGVMPNGETKLQTLVDELKKLDKVILFIDEIHMLIGATNDSAMDFANMFKEGLGRGQIKVIGATTTEEYERYILRDKAFVRRFARIEVEEPNRELTIKILMGTLPKIEKETGAKLKYTPFIQSEIMGFIVDITSEYRRIYGIGSRYPDICLTLLKEAFSQCVFENRNEVDIFDVRRAIENSKNIYPDVIRKELPNFDLKFKKIFDEERGIS